MFFKSHYFKSKSKCNPNFKMRTSYPPFRPKLKTFSLSSMHNEVLLHHLDPKIQRIQVSTTSLSKIKNPQCVGSLEYVSPSNSSWMAKPRIHGLLGSKMFLQKVGAFFRSSGFNLYDPHETLEKIMSFIFSFKKNKYVTVAQYILRK